MRFFLLGFMGTGKTYWGRQWAEQHNLDFYDLDEIIEKEEGEAIEQIFEKKGEDYFRQKESIILRSLFDADNCIISCGGGTPCFFDNLAWMKERGVTIFLEAPPDYLLENVKKEDSQKRPLFRDVNEAEAKFFIEKMLGERNPFYTAADYTLDARTLDKNSLDEIINKKNA